VSGVVHTIGHSTHPIDEFVAILRAHGIETIADVRTVPKSRRNPQFGQDELPGSLAAAGLGYRHLKALGGLRKTSAASPNGAWRNESFRGYADHMQTAEFAVGIAELIELAERSPTAIMCAEAVPWRCHRSLVGDALLVRGFEVLDIFSATSARPHTLTSFARVDGTEITYPPEDATDRPPGISSR
jgi:uncharacterized protein (DUF488 family)